MKYRILAVFWDTVLRFGHQKYSGLSTQVFMQSTVLYINVYIKEVYIQSFQLFVWFVSQRIMTLLYGQQQAWSGLKKRWSCWECQLTAITKLCSIWITWPWYPSLLLNMELCRSDCIFYFIANNVQRMQLTIHIFVSRIQTWQWVSDGLLHWNRLGFKFTVLLDLLLKLDCPKSDISCIVVHSCNLATPHTDPWFFVSTSK